MDYRESFGVVSWRKRELEGVGWGERKTENA